MEEEVSSILRGGGEVRDLIALPSLFRFVLNAMIAGVGLRVGDLS
jgi:hypothetical protein